MPYEETTVLGESRVLSSDQFPSPVKLGQALMEPHPLPPELIGGVLRCGHKMIISGGSKAGKSFLLMELAIALSEGWTWLGFPCRKSRVLYVNFEIDQNSCFNRFAQIYRRYGIEPKYQNDILVWNLRGKTRPLNEMEKMIEMELSCRHCDVLILDPIYKVIMGDENSASDMGAFCNQFDRICDSTGASLIYCHHHSKGMQGKKRAMDRASGSGVFARDPDALVDMTQLDIPDAVLHRLGREKATGWRVEGTLREFAPFEPINVWFEYPVHIIDNESLGTIPLEGTPLAMRQKNRIPTAEKHRNTLLSAYQKCRDKATGQCPLITRDDMAQAAGRTPRYITDALKECEADFQVYQKKYVFRTGETIPYEWISKIEQMQK